MKKIILLQFSALTFFTYTTSTCERRLTWANNHCPSIRTYHLEDIVHAKMSVDEVNWKNKKIT